MAGMIITDRPISGEELHNLKQDVWDGVTQRYCLACGRKLRRIGYGAMPKQEDWDTRQYHKTCWKKINWADAEWQWWLKHERLRLSSERGPPTSLKACWVAPPEHLEERLSAYFSAEESLESGEEGEVLQLVGGKYLGAPDFEGDEDSSGESGSDSDEEGEMEEGWVDSLLEWAGVDQRPPKRRRVVNSLF